MSTINTTIHHLTHNDSLLATNGSNWENMVDDSRASSDLALGKIRERPIARIAVRAARMQGNDEEEHWSATSQMDAGRHYCAFKQFDLDLDASLAHQDEGSSGFRQRWRERPGVMAYYEAAERGEFQHLVFSTISCLGRNVRDAFDLIDAFEKLGVTIHMVSEQIDGSTPMGRVLTATLLAAAEMQSSDAAESTHGTSCPHAKAKRSVPS